MQKLRAIASILMALGAAVPGYAAAGFIKTGSMAVGRTFFPALTLADGSVLVASSDTLERYDRLSGTFSPAGTLTTNRGFGLTATLLQDGRVLIVGGQFADTSLASAEIYDPVAGTVAPTGSMSVPRSFHAATLLADGRVLVTGGHQFNFPNSALDTAEVWDPGTGTFVSQGNMSARRQDHTATLLSDGQVLIAGGYSETQSGLAGAEIFDPATGGFTPTGSLAEGRGNHTATSLASGEVVIMGGHSGFPGNSLDTVEIYDPSAAAFAPGGAMSTPRGAHTTTELADGRVLIVGGFTTFPSGVPPLASAEIYDPATAAFTPSATMHEARGRHAAALLPGGEVLVAGGQGPCCGLLATAELFSLSIVDTTAPIVTVPADITVVQSGPEGAAVSFSASATDDVDTAPALSCEPPSGSVFPVGTTTVVCTANDSSGNQGSASFTVTVLEALDIVMTIDREGKVDPQTGLATLRGTVRCNQTAQGGLTIELTQGSSAGPIQGSTGRSFACVPPSLVWIASVNAADRKFHPGKAEARVAATLCGPSGCDADAVTSQVRLVAGGAGATEFPITKVVDRKTRMPGTQVNFGSFSAPFVRNGTIVFQGYGPTLSLTGVYSSSGKGLSVVADTRTLVPGGSGAFTNFNSLAFDGQTLAFQGFDTLGRAGLYVARAGTLSLIANGDTQVPGGGGVFGGFIGPVVSGDRVAFRGSSDSSPFSAFGIYAGNTEGLSLIADQQTPVPGGLGTFSFFAERPVFELDTVVFPASGSGPGQNGLFASRDGILTTLADQSTPVPSGTGNFLFIGTPALELGVVAFLGIDQAFKQGLYRSFEGSLTRIADTQTVIPGQSATFGSFSAPVLEGGIVAFGAVDSRFLPVGLYGAERDDILFTIADVGTPVPGGQGFFAFFGPGPVLAGGNVAFLGSDSTFTQGIYVSVSGELHEVISATDTLEGKAIAFLELANPATCDFFGCLASSGFDGTRVAFHVTFADSSQGIYYADVVTP